MKSPVFGKHRGRFTSKRTWNPCAGNVNMRGKKTKRMSCGCCICIDMRGRVTDKIHREYMRRGDDDE